MPPCVCPCLQCWRHHSSCWLWMPRLNLASFSLIMALLKFFRQNSYSVLKLELVAKWAVAISTMAFWANPSREALAKRGSERRKSRQKARFSEVLQTLSITLFDWLLLMLGFACAVWQLLLRIASWKNAEKSVLTSLFWHRMLRLEVHVSPLFILAWNNRTSGRINHVFFFMPE